MTANQATNLEGLFKEVYSSKGVIEAAPTWEIVQRDFEFEAGEAIGEAYVLAVVLTKEAGFVYAPTMGVNTVPSSPTPIPATILHAKVQSYGIYLASQLAYAAAARAAQAGKAAFKSAYEAVLRNMLLSHKYRLECSLLYGRDGLGVVDDNVGGLITITDSSFASGIWGAGLKGTVLEAFSTTAETATQRNGDLVIDKVDISNRQITVTGTSSAVVQNDVLYFKSARTTTGWNECVGLHRILVNRGELFDIDAEDFDAWAAQEFPVDGQLSMTSIMKASALSQAYGLERAILYCAPERFAQLASDEAALRRYLDSGVQAKRGPKGIEFQMGAITIEIKAHPMLKLGHAMLLPKDEVHRGGSVDITSKLPGSGTKLEVQVANSMAIEFRQMSDVFIFLEVPARACLLTGITD